ncbi:hypothetical protein JW906_04495 [bacterium]|nr:hypothetical protein [bacterium]
MDTPAAFGGASKEKPNHHTPHGTGMIHLEIKNNISFLGMQTKNPPIPSADILFLTLSIELAKMFRVNDFSIRAPMIQMHVPTKA